MIALLALIAIMVWPIARLGPLLMIAAVEGSFAPRRALAATKDQVGRLTAVVFCVFLLAQLVAPLSNGLMAVSTGPIVEMTGKSHLLAVPLLAVTSLPLRLYFFLVVVCLVGELGRVLMGYGEVDLEEVFK